MQVILPTLQDAEEYALDQAHRHVRRPLHCPQCRGHKTFRVIGFYSRSVTARMTGTVICIKVRRFLCESCRRTTSVLPSFAQPYRLVCCFTVERYFNGVVEGRDTLKWRGLLQRYWTRFNAWIPDLVLIVGQALGLSPPNRSAGGSWGAVVGAYGHLDHATRTLVRLFRVTLFGRYQCHSPVSAIG